MKEEKIYQLLSKEFNVDKKVLNIILEAEKEVVKEFQELDKIMEYNQYKILKAFQETRVSDMHFAWNTGYGYDDPGRETLEKVYSYIFKTEAALVRPTIVNGTHALTLAIAGQLRPEDELIYCTGAPYDTLEEAIGIRGEGKGSLKEFGITYKQIDLTDKGDINIKKLTESITKKTKMVVIQRATGYGFRKAILIEEIKKTFQAIKDLEKDILCMVDNCYGEFLDIVEPTEVGADIMAGSLIKNPGGGLALTGGYIVGKKELIDNSSYRMTSPGIGGECGLTFGQSRNMFQGLFLAPKTVNGAVKGAILCAKVFENLGFEVSPKASEGRSDIIESIKLGSKEAVVAFCQGIQAAAPIDSHVVPEPWDMPGYESPVVMAAGAFVQGSSIELSADAPIREPYAVYFQGGLTYEHSKFGVMKALNTLYERGIVKV